MAGPKKTPATSEPLADMPPAPEKPSKRAEQLFIAYSEADGFDLHDVVVFGVKVEALEYAMEQDPVWKCIPARKGESVRDAIGAKRAAR